MSEPPKPRTASPAEIESWNAEIDRDNAQADARLNPQRRAGADGASDLLGDSRRQARDELRNAAPDSWTDPDITGEKPPPAATAPPELMAALGAFPQDVFNALVTLGEWHSVLLAGAQTEAEIRLAFIPLLVARCFFGLEGGLLPPSKIERAIRAEANRGWRGYEFAERLTGRPPSPWTEFVRQRIEELAQQVTPHPVAQQHFKNWILTAGAHKPNRWGRSASPGTRALLDYVEGGWKARGHSDGEINHGKREIMRALDNMRRRARGERKSADAD